MFNINQKMEKSRAINLSPVVLAFVGDAVYSLYIREKYIFEADYKPNYLQKLAVSMVNASAQAKFINEIIDKLTEEELSIFKRGRNAKKTTRSRSCSASDYNSSTGFEAVLGYLYLTGNEERLNFILNQGK